MTIVTSTKTKLIENKAKIKKSVHIRKKQEF